MKLRAAVVLLALVLAALPVAAYVDCETTTVSSAGGGCFWYTTCYIYDDNGNQTGVVHGPFQQCG